MATFRVRAPDASGLPSARATCIAYAGCATSGHLARRQRSSAPVAIPPPGRKLRRGSAAVAPTALYWRTKCWGETRRRRFGAGCLEALLLLSLLRPAAVSIAVLPRPHSGMFRGLASTPYQTVLRSRRRHHCGHFGWGSWPHIRLAHARGRMEARAFEVKREHAPCCYSLRHRRFELP